jgi:outer membrane protein OmpA-like peptidoglycan-associated protein
MRIVGVGFVSLSLIASAVCWGTHDAYAQDNMGPLAPHTGARIAWGFSNRFGPDAEAVAIFLSATPVMLSVSYQSTRGLNVARNISVTDRQNSRTYVLGFARDMPLTIAGSTTLGISGASLIELRETGRTALSIITDANMSSISGELILVEKDIRVPVLVQDKIMQVQAVRAEGRFGSGGRQGTGKFLFVNNRNNPMMLESQLKFSWEAVPRASRVIRVAASASMRSAMEQALSTVRSYDLYGIRFDFDKATLQPSAAALIEEIAVTMKNHPAWTLRIVGHTDSIGPLDHNMKLSAARAASVASALTLSGIDPSRLQTDGKGPTQQKATNDTLHGRALNRRVELKRTDR